MATVAKRASASGGIIGALTAVKSWPERLRVYVDGIKREMRLVTWPNRAQVQSTTAVVLVTVFVFALFFGMVDYVLTFGQAALYDYYTQ